MKFNKTALFLAVSAIASFSVANLTTDLTTENPTAELLEAKSRDSAPDTNSATALETIAPMQAVATPVVEQTVAATIPVSTPTVNTVTQTLPALINASSINMPPPPPGSQSFIQPTQVKLDAQNSTLMTKGLADSSATATSQSENASTVRADKSGVAMSSDVLFDFGGYKLSAQAHAMLNRVTPKLKAMDLDIVLATGHADNIGSDSANESIGLKRANAVRDYFIQAGIPAEKVKVESKGSRESVTTDCDNKKGRVLRDCLAPDRRVNIVAQGAGSAETIAAPVGAKASTASSARIDASTAFTVFFEGSSIKLKATDNDLLDEIADAAIEADKVHLRGRSALGDSEQRKARAIARGWAVRQGLVFRGVEKEDIRIFYRTKGLKSTENNERVDIELIPRKIASK